MYIMHQSIHELHLVYSLYELTQPEEIQDS